MEKTQSQPVSTVPEVEKSDSGPTVAHPGEDFNSTITSDATSEADSSSTSAESSAEKKELARIVACLEKYPKHGQTLAQDLIKRFTEAHAGAARDDCEDFESVAATDGSDVAFRLWADKEEDEQGKESANKEVKEALSGNTMGRIYETRLMAKITNLELTAKNADTKLTVNNTDTEPTVKSTNTTLTTKNTVVMADKATVEEPESSANSQQPATTILTAAIQDNVTTKIKRDVKAGKPKTQEVKQSAKPKQATQTVNGNKGEKNDTAKIDHTGRELITSTTKKVILTATIQDVGNVINVMPPGSKGLADSRWAPENLKKTKGRKS